MPFRHISLHWRPPRALSRTGLGFRHQQRPPDEDMRQVATSKAGGFTVSVPLPESSGEETITTVIVSSPCGRRKSQGKRGARQLGVPTVGGGQHLPVASPGRAGHSLSTLHAPALTTPSHITHRHAPRKPGWRRCSCRPVQFPAGRRRATDGRREGSGPCRCSLPCRSRPTWLQCCADSRAGASARGGGAGGWCTAH